jgi:preprotein translocase subunit SecG
MKISRIALAVVSGVLFAYGYFALSGLEHWRATRVLIGIFFGVGMAISMIQQPERFTRKMALFGFAPVLACLVIVVAFTSTRIELLTTVVCTLAFLGVQIAFAFLPSESPVGSQPQQIQDTEQDVSPNA